MEDVQYFERPVLLLKKDGTEVRVFMGIQHIFLLFLFSPLIENRGYLQGSAILRPHSPNPSVPSSFRPSSPNHSQLIFGNFTISWLYSIIVHIGTCKHTYLKLILLTKTVKIIA